MNFKVTAHGGVVTHHDKHIDATIAALQGLSRAMDAGEMPSHSIDLANRSETYSLMFPNYIAGTGLCITTYKSVIEFIPGGSLSQ